MTSIKDWDHFLNAFRHAKSIGKDEQLLEKLFRYSDDEDKKVVIFPDKSFNQLYNFSFSICTLKRTMDGDVPVDKWNFWYNGGIIFHSEKDGWQINT